LSRFTLRLAITLQAAISAGDGLALIALANRVYQSSHASWAVAAVFLALTVPITTLSPVAGLLLDRLPTRPVLVTAAAVEAAVALGLAAASGVPATLALAFGFGVCAAILQPGLGAVVPRLAGGTAIARANSYLQAATWAGFSVGPLLAGLLIGTIATGAGVALAGVSVTLWQAVSAYGFGGLASGAETVATRSVLNHRAPEEMAGRVFALYSGLLFGATSLAMAVAGALLTVLGARTVLVLAGCGGMLAGTAGWVGMAVRQRTRRRPAVADGEGAA
jgi:MFS family permease